MIDMRPICVKIRDNSTGEVVSHEDVGSFDEDGFVEFIWSEGNYSCDCNRARFFHRAKGLDAPDDPPCGEERYSIKITCDEEVVYEDED